MISKKNEIIAGIARARIELEQALDDLKVLPMNDPLIFGFVSRALTNYLHVNRATVCLLCRSLKGRATPPIIRWLDGLQTLTGRMEFLVKELNGAPTKARPPITLHKIDIVILIRRACGFYRPAAARKQVRVAFKTRSIRQRVIWSDRIAVAAIMDNLLSNALKFSPPGGTISVEVAQREQSIICKVQDEGPGVSPAKRLHLFHKDPRTRGNLTKPAGFGLIVAGDLVAQLGGHIWCESDRRHGACFSFRLPVAGRACDALRQVSRFE